MGIPFAMLFAGLDPGSSVQPEAELSREQKFKVIQAVPSLRPKEHFSSQDLIILNRCSHPQRTLMSFVWLLVVIKAIINTGATLELFPKWGGPCLF